MDDELSVRPFADASDYERMVDYFLQATPDFLRGMGVDPARLPERSAWLARLLGNHARPNTEKETGWVAWWHRGAPVGHSSINKIVFGKEAFIHLHLWRPDLRKAGIGGELFKRSANHFLRRFELERLLCEPWAENPAPNRVLTRLGFRFVKRHRTVPGVINFEQDVNRYELTHELP